MKVPQQAGAPFLTSFVGELDSVTRLKGIEKALEQLRRHPNDKKTIDTLESAVKRFKESPTGTWCFDVLLVTPDPLLAAEAALKHLQQQPNDKKSLEDLERAVDELKKAKANTAPAKPRPPAGATPPALIHEPTRVFSKAASSRESA